MSALALFALIGAFIAGALAAAAMSADRITELETDLGLAQHELAKANERAAEATVAAASARAQVEWHGGRR